MKIVAVVIANRFGNYFLFAWCRWGRIDQMKVQQLKSNFYSVTTGKIARSSFDSLALCVLIDFSLDLFRASTIPIGRLESVTKLYICGF